MNNLMKSNKLTLILTAVVMTLAGQNALAGRADMRQANMEVMQIIRQDPILIPGSNFLEPDISYLFAGSDDSKIDTHLTIAMPNVRVRLFIDRIRNVVVANGGVETYSDGSPISDVELITGSWESDIENGWNGSNLPSPGQTLHLYPDPDGIGMFEGLVFGACDSFTSYDMYHDATIWKYGFGEIGKLEGVDTTTIESTGYYPVNYTVQATDDTGGVSDFHFQGHVTVECSANNDLQ